MKKFIVCFIAVLFIIATPAFALYDDNSNTATGGNATSGDSTSTAIGGNGFGFSNATGGDANAGNVSGFGNTAYSPSSSSKSTNINTPIANARQNQKQAQDQGQGQGQIAVGQVQVQDNSSYESKAYSFAPPALSSNKGMNEGNIYSIFGGIGLAEDSEYVLAIEKLAVIERLEKLGYISKEEAISEGRICLMQLKDSTLPKRILAIGPKTRGRHLLNLFGLIALDSWVNESKVNEKVIQKEKNISIEKTFDKEITGNAGNINQ